MVQGTVRDDSQVSVLLLQWMKCTLISNPNHGPDPSHGAVVGSHLDVVILGDILDIERP